MAVEFEKYGFRPNPDYGELYEFEDPDKFAGFLQNTEEGIKVVTIGRKMSGGVFYDEIGTMPATNQSLALLLKTFGIKR